MRAGVVDEVSLLVSPVLYARAGLARRVSAQAACWRTIGSSIDNGEKVTFTKRMLRVK